MIPLILGDLNLLIAKLIRLRLKGDLRLNVLILKIQYDEIYVSKCDVICILYTFNHELA